MLLNGQNLEAKIVKIVEKEAKLLEEFKKINERYATAENLNDKKELEVIDSEGTLLEQKYKMHFTEKIVLMTIAINKNKNFAYN